MGIDVRISRVEKQYCPHCGKEISGEVVATEISGGPVWYDWLKKIGYYVPYEKRTEENNWYGKDMTLAKEQARPLYDYISLNSPYNGDAVAGLIAKAVLEGNDIVINADW